jgi:hypothetical protein
MPSSLPPHASLSSTSNNFISTIHQQPSHGSVAYPPKPFPSSYLQPTKPALNCHKLTHGQTTTNNDPTLAS